MRVVSFNIHHAVGTDGRLDLERVALTIAALQPDVVGLQEVDRSWSERSEYVDQARALSRRLRMRLAYGAALDLDPPAADRPRRRYGNAVLARYPVVNRSNLLLPRTVAVEQRALLRARIDLGHGRTDVYVTHLEARDAVQRALQAAAVATTLARRGGSRLLLADLNTEPYRGEVASLAAVVSDAWAAGVGRGYTHPARKPTRRIDAVLHSADLVPTAAWVPATDASDHRPVVATVEVSSRPRRATSSGEPSGGFPGRRPG